LQAQRQPHVTESDDGDGHDVTAECPSRTRGKSVLFRQDQMEPIHIGCHSR
jgi:hypothetical protein